VMCALRVSIVKEKGPGRFLIATRASTQLGLGTEEPASHHQRRRRPGA